MHRIVRRQYEPIQIFEYMKIITVSNGINMIKDVVFIVV